MRFIAFCCLAVGCASTQPSTSSHHVPLIASTDPVSTRPVAEAEPVVEPDEDMSAAVLLQRAFTHLRAGRNAEASAHFRAAVRTGFLNDAGRAWAYWHIYVTERDRGHLDASAEALADFVAVGEDLLDGRPDDHSLEAEENRDFVSRFDLGRRVSLARAMLSVFWSQRVPRYGRSETHPIVVSDRREIDYYIELSSPCGNDEAVDVSKAAGPELARENTELVTVRCPGVTLEHEFYFAPTAALQRH